jgi:hypothetical protein
MTPIIISVTVLIVLLALIILCIYHIKVKKFADIVVEETNKPKTNQREITTNRITKQKTEKERQSYDDAVRLKAYLLASNDGYKKDAHEYWYEAEKEIRNKP